MVFAVSCSGKNVKPEAELDGGSEIGSVADGSADGSDHPCLPPPELSDADREKGIQPDVPVITSIEPKEGVRTGGTLVTIRGSHFKEGMSVTIGHQECVGVTFHGPEQLTCYTSADRGGRSGTQFADVLVKRTDRQCGMLAAAFKYFPAVAISPRSKTLSVSKTFLFQASDGQAPFHFAVASGPGTIDENSGVFTAPSEPGVTLIRVMDQAGTTSEAIVRTNPALQISPTTQVMAVSNSFQFAAVGGVPPYSFELVSGDGELTPDGGFTSDLMPGEAAVEVVDQLGDRARATVTVAPALALTPASKTIAVRNTIDFLASGGVPPYGFKIRSGLGSLDAEKGQFIAADQPGTVSIELFDELGNLTRASLQVNPALMIVPPTKTVVLGDSIAFAASGGVPPYTFSVAGDGRAGQVDENTGFYTAAEIPGEEMVRVTDAVGNMAEAHVIISPDGIVPQRLATGFSHSCAILNGSAKCWGNNRHGQLGNKTETSSLKPVQVAGLTQGVAAVVAGQYHTCALANGGVKCWGDNSFGQLGNNRSESSSAPVQVSGLDRGVQAISAGSFHTCAIKQGSVLCWGDNRRGQLGNRTTISSRVPVQTWGLTRDATAVVAGAAHSCAIVSGGVKCWGFNSSGQLGNGTLRTSTEPVSVVGLEQGVASLDAGGFHNCALDQMGIVRCWGHNGAGQLGDETTQNRYLPVQVKALLGTVRSVKAGYYHTCALVNNSVQCWGYNDSGQSGSERTQRRLLRPISIPGLHDIEAVASGVAHTCALLPQGVSCWGYNGYGQFGNRTQLSSHLPVPLVPLSGTPRARETE